MRSTVILVVVVLIVQSFTESKRAHGLSNYIKNRPKPREIRGFKPEHMSTAIGFGKRHSSFEPPEKDDDGAFIPLVNMSPERAQLLWITRAIRDNPQLLKRLERLSSDQSDKQSTSNLFSFDRN